MCSHSASSSSQVVDRDVVQVVRGHSSIAITLNRYSHVVPTLHPEAAGQVEKLFSGPADALDGPVGACMDARDGVSSLRHAHALPDLAS
jgi:hypothetical protein